MKESVGESDCDADDEKRATWRMLKPPYILVLEGSVCLWLDRFDMPCVLDWLTSVLNGLESFYPGADSVRCRRYVRHECVLGRDVSDAGTL